MVWLLRLANLRCPCLGLTSNELRELPFTCIKGAIRESFSISPHKWERPSRHVPLPRDCSCTSLWCPWRQELFLGLIGLKTWAERRSKVRLLKTRMAAKVALNSSLPSPTLSGLISLTSPSSFLLSVTALLWALLFFYIFLYPRSLVKGSRVGGGGERKGSYGSNPQSQRVGRKKLGKAS